MSSYDKATSSKSIEDGAIKFNDSRTEEDLRLFLNDIQRSSNEIRLLSETEQKILRAINVGLESWHGLWIKSFLADGREFKIVYDLIEGLLHYEDQIKGSVSILSIDRTNAIAQAVARLVDCGNAILNIDLIVREEDETSSELDSSSTTAIKLFKAHLRAQKLREKLLNDYFSEDKRSYTNGTAEELILSQLSINTSFVSLQIPGSHSGLPSPTMDRSYRGSNQSINTMSDGRRTPILASQIEIKKFNHVDLTNQLDITHMTATIRSQTFKADSTTRLAFLPGILAKVEGLLTVPTNAEKVARCFELLDSLFDTMEALAPDSRTKEVEAISIALLKPLVTKVYIDDRDSLVEYQHAHWITLLISLLRLMTPQDFSSFLGHFNNLADLGAFLKDLLFIIKRLLTTSDRAMKSFHSQPDIESMSGFGGPMFPECWIDMTHMACATFLASLTNLYQILRQLFGSNLLMWSNFIDCLISFNLYDPLKHDRFMLKERQRLMAADLRQTSAEYVWITWDSLNLDQRQKLLDDFIDPLLMACISMSSKQRSILLPIFYDMMHCDYSSQYINRRDSVYSVSSKFASPGIYCNVDLRNDGVESLPPIIERSSSLSPDKCSAAESLPYLGTSTGNTDIEDGTVLTKFTHMTIGKLNNLMIDQELGDESFKVDLCMAIAGELNPKYSKRSYFERQEDSDRFRNMAKLTADLLSEYMQICLDLRRANELLYKDLQLLCLFKFILFFKDKVDRTELYLNNLFKLFSLHLSANRLVEAGLVLFEYAKTLPWSDKPISNHNRIIMRHLQISDNLPTVGRLKSFLYSIIIEYFDQGKIWEAAIPLCRELMDLYQYKTFEYSKLSVIFQKLSQFFGNIVETGARSNPEYFRVSFHGAGFPSCLQGTTMVYRGKPFEKLGDFQAAMLGKYPDAALYHSLATPDESILSDTNARYLQINACSPVVDLGAKFGDDLAKMEESAISYYKYNECDKFQFSRRIGRPASFHTRSPGSENGPTSGGDNFGDMWRERTTLTSNTLPGMLPFFPVYLIETSVISPIECAIEDLERTNDRLSCMVNRFKADKRHTEDIRLLGQLLLGIVDAAVNGGIAKYEEAFFPAGQPERSSSSRRSSSSNRPSESPYVSLNNDSDYVDFSYGKQANGNNIGPISRPSPEGEGKPTEVQVDKLKCLIARQVPLLDVAIRLHGDRVADVMRPQHEHLESSYRRLKQHVTTKYSRYLPPDYSRHSASATSLASLRSYRSSHRSPSRPMRLPLSPGLAGSATLGSRHPSKRMSDVGFARLYSPEPMGSPGDGATCSIPYQQLGRERRSLPFLTGLSRSSAAPADQATKIVQRPTNLSPDLDKANPESIRPPALPTISVLDVNHSSSSAAVDEIGDAYREIEGLFESINSHDNNYQLVSTDRNRPEPIPRLNDNDGSRQVPAPSASPRTEEVKLVYL